MNEKTKKSSNNNICSDGIEILCIGTELLLGNIQNGNARWLSEQLASLGLPHYRQTVIGDNFNRLKEEVLSASIRSRILITTGGLGPTPDDITTNTIASAFQTSLENREEIWEEIKQKLKYKTLSPTSNNKKQALFPADAVLIPNP